MAKLRQLNDPMPIGATASAGSGTVNADAELASRVARVINLIRPTVQADGGDIELVGISADKVVNIRLHGACVGCPSSAITLQMGIERNLRTHIPEIKGIMAVD